MENKLVIDTLKECGSLLEGHFLLSSGKHSDRYCQCAKVLQYPALAQKVLAQVVSQLSDVKADVVIGPAMGGIVVAYELARQLNLPGYFTERVDNQMCLRRGFAIEKGTRVLIAEDVVTTGKSTMETVNVIESYGGVVVGLCCIVDRRPNSVTLPFPMYSATTLEVKAYDAAECPLCKTSLELVKPGSRIM